MLKATKGKLRGKQDKGRDDRGRERSQREQGSMDGEKQSQPPVLLGLPPSLGSKTGRGKRGYYPSLKSYGVRIKHYLTPQGWKCHQKLGKGLVGATTEKTGKCISLFKDHIQTLQSRGSAP